MPAKNLYHDAVIRALVADGWTITDDPLKLEYGDRNLYVESAAYNGAALPPPADQGFVRWPGLNIDFTDYTTIA